jgi:hypothetical protein
MAEWSKYWNIKIIEERTQAIYFSHKISPPESLLTLNGWNIPFVSNVKCLDLTFHTKITWSLRISTSTIKAKAFRALIRTYSTFKS